MFFIEKRKLSPMTKLSPTLTQLRIFVTVADTGSFTEAGLELDMTQSAVSHAVASLEKILNAKLLSRGRHGAELTVSGQKILIHARKNLQAVEAIKQELAVEQGELIGTLRITAFRSAAAYLLPPIIAWFKTQHPKVVVSVHSIEGKLGWIERNLLEGNSDIGITALPVLEKLITWEIAHDEFVVLTSEAHATSAFSWEQLEAAPLILCGDDCTYPVLELWKQNGRELKGYQRVPEDSVVLSMVEHGLGLSILPRLAAEPLPEKVKVFSLPTPLSRRIGVAIAPENADSPLISSFIEAVRNKELLAKGSVVQQGILSLNNYPQSG